MQKTLFVGLFVIAMIAVVLIAGSAAGYYGVASTEKRNALEDRLRQLEDREEIRRLLIDYGRFLDKRDFAAFSGLFAETEGEWIGGLGKARGSEAIRKLMEERIGKPGGKVVSPNYHIFTNMSIQATGDRASATTKWMFVVQGDGTRPQPLYLGHYEDTMVRENGRWKFLRRTVYSDIPSDDSLSQN
jgi:hypothetical protein